MVYGKIKTLVGKPNQPSIVDIQITEILALLAQKIILPKKQPVILVRK